MPEDHAPDDASADAASAAIDAYLAADDVDWAEEPAGDVGNGTESTVYRSGDVEDHSDDDTEWVVEVRHGDSRIDLRVQSPLTVRGDESR